MRRGIATFRFLAALAAYAVPVLAGGVLYLAVRLDLASRPAPPKITATVEAPPAVAYRAGALEIRGLVLAPQDLPGATLTDCRLVGDWRGSDLRGALYDPSTRWPDRFQPEGSWVRLAERQDAASSPGRCDA